MLQRRCPLGNIDTYSQEIISKAPRTISDRVFLHADHHYFFVFISNSNNLFRVAFMLQSPCSSRCEIRTSLKWFHCVLCLLEFDRLCSHDRSIPAVTVWDALMWGAFGQPNTWGEKCAEIRTRLLSAQLFSKGNKTFLALSPKKLVFVLTVLAGRTMVDYPSATNK